jgi:hypothetical protein
VTARSAGVADQEDAMALDVSQELGSPQLAGMPVCPRGQAWRQASRQNYSLLAVLVAPLAARIVFGRRPDAAPAQTPQFGQVAWLVVTKDELALVRRRKGRNGVTFEAISRVPLAEVRAFDLGRGRLVSPLTITFGDGGTWRLETQPYRKWRATAAAAVVSGLLQHV